MMSSGSNGLGGAASTGIGGLGGAVTMPLASPQSWIVTKAIQLSSVSRKVINVYKIFSSQNNTFLLS